MATITIKIPDAQLNDVARTFAAFSYPPDNVPSAQEHIDAIESKIYELFEPHLKEAVKKDPEVEAKRAEYEAILNQKFEDSKDKK